MTTIDKNTVVTLVDTSSYIGNINLPRTSDIANRVLIFKDSVGTFHTNPFTLSTTGGDSFENSSNITTLSNTYGSICLYSDPTTFTWKTLFSYDNSDHSASNWSLYPAINGIIMNNNDINSVHSISAYGGYPVEFASSIDMKQHSICNIDVVEANVLRIGYSGIGLPSTTSLQFYNPFGSNYFVTYNYYGINDPIPIAADWAYFPAKSNLDMSANVIENVNQLNVNYIYGNGMGAIVSFGAYVDMLSNEISNVLQTSNTYSAATNIVTRRVYFDNPLNYSIDSSDYFNVLTTSPTTPLTYINPTAFYTYLNCTISFRCDNSPDSFAYFLKLSNITMSTDLSGEIFGKFYPFQENKYNILSSNHSITFQEQFNVSSWSNNDTFVPMLFVTSVSVNSLYNMKFSMVYEPVLN